VELQAQVAREEKVEVELETEVELELQQYEQNPKTALRSEKGIDKEEFIGLISTLRSNSPKSDNVISIQEQLKKYEYGLLEERAHYEKIFSEPIFGTKAYFYTCQGDKVLPIFHPLQRPPKQILAVRVDNQMRWLLLSEHEANDVRMHLQELYEKQGELVQDVWLVQPHGSPFINTRFNEEFPVDEEEVENGLTEINVLGGNMGYLDQNVSEFEAFLAKNPELAVLFLKLRTFRDEKQNQILRRCPAVLKLLREATKLDPSHQMFRARAKREQMRQGRLIPQSEVEAKLFPLRKVKDLNVKYVKFLGIDWEKRDADPVTKAALKELDSKISEELYPKDTPAREEELKRRAEKLTDEQMRRLCPYQGPYVFPDQIQWLPISKVRHLEHPEQIYRKEENVYLLSEEQVQGLEEHQRNLIPYVSPKFYGSFDQKWQVESVPAEHIDKIKPQLWIHLRKAQVKGITIKKAEFLEHLAIPEKFRHGDLLKKIPAQYLNYVCAEQIREITDPELIPELERIAKNNKGIEEIEAGRWTSWIAPHMVKHIDFASQLQFLQAREQIREVSAEHVHNLDPTTQVPLISQAQVPHLHGEKQIRACPNALVRYLTAEQLPHIADRQIPYLIGSEQVQTINDDTKFALLKAEDCADAGYNNQIQWISEKQFPLVTQEQVKGLKNDQLLKLKETVEDLKWNTLQKGLTEAQVKFFDSEELIALLSEEQIRKWLTEEQVKFLEEEWQIQGCPDKLVRFLILEQILSIANRQVPFLVGKEQVGAVKDEEKFKLLTAKDLTEGGITNQMQWISEGQLAFVQPNQVKGLNSYQIYMLRKVDRWEQLRHMITLKQIKNFKTKALVALLTKRQIHAHLGDHQVHLLITPAQIQACPDQHVKCLDVKTQLPHILPKQVPHLEGREQVLAIPCEERFVHMFAKKHFLLLTEEQVELLSGEQIGRMDTREEIARLSEDQLVFLSKKGVQACEDPLVQQIQENQRYYHLISKVNPGQLHLIISPKAAANISDEQVRQFNPQKYNELEKKHPLWGRITPEAVKKINVEKIKCIPGKMLKHLEDPKKIRNISFWKIKHLTREQLRKRSWGQFIVYAIGVITLGLASSLVALVAHVTFITLVAWLISRPKGRWVIKELHTNPYRMYRFFEVYYSSAKPKKKKTETEVDNPVVAEEGPGPRVLRRANSLSDLRKRSKSRDLKRSKSETLLHI